MSNDDDPHVIVGEMAGHALPVAMAGLVLIPIVGWLVVKAAEVSIALLIWLWRLVFPVPDLDDPGPKGYAAMLERQHERRDAIHAAKYDKERAKKAKRQAKIDAKEAAKRSAFLRLGKKGLDTLSPAARAAHDAELARSAAEFQVILDRCKTRQAEARNAASAVPAVFVTVPDDFE